MTFYDKEEYLKSPRGLYGRYHWRQLRGWTNYSFDEEPKSKNSMKLPEKIQFQQKLLEKMKASRRRAYRAPIIAEMSFDTTAQNPPHIHTIVKNYQDLFEKSLDESIKRKGLVYQNDKKIYGLSVRYHIGEKPRIRASFSPFRDFLQDLDLVSDIISGDYSYEAGCHDLEEQIFEIHGRSENDYFDDSIESLRDFIQNKDLFISAVGEKAYEAMLLSHRMSAQEQLLKGLNLGISDLYSFYMPLIMEQKFGRKLTPSDKELEKIPGVTSDWIANSPIRIQLPNAPLVKGESDKFKQKVRESLEIFHREHPIFIPLHIPVNLNILYKPPKEPEKDYNDLDNIMRRIVPVFNEIFEPPSTYVSHINLDDIRDKRLYESLKKSQDRVPKSIRTSISGYDIFKMPRDQEDESDGFLTASFTSGTVSHSSPRYVMDRIVEKWIECCDD
ncbi:conserved hypothetical protein [delta proteobacterium NaphS2]|nr:conserved hypothetical protein [delta proteobacterium NaphS2]